MKKLLVLAAGILQVPVIKKAKEMGVYVVATDGDPNAVGLRLADKPIVVNITSEEDMLRVAREEHVDGVIHPCSEVSMNVMGRINDELGLSGISRETAIRATNKHLMREAFEEYGAPSPKSFCFENAEEAWSCFCNELPNDGILKPSRNSGSRGIAKVPSGWRGLDCMEGKSEFVKLFERAKSESRDNSVMLEQFVEGPEFSVEIIVWDGQVHVLTVTDKKTTEAPYFVELGHNQPSVFPDDIVEKIKSASVAGVKALAVNNCACHAEVKVQNDEAYIMEVGARLGGDFISTELTHLSTGIDMVAAAINCALGIEPNLEATEEKHGVCIRYFCPKPGKLISISNTKVLCNPRVYQWEIYHKEGDTIPEVTSSLCRSGHVIVVEKDAKEAIAYAEYLLNEVKMETV